VAADERLAVAESARDPLEVDADRLIEERRRGRALAVADKASGDADARVPLLFPE